MSELEQAMLRHYEARGAFNKPPPRKRRSRAKSVVVDSTSEIEAALQAILAEVSITRHVSEHGIKARCRVFRVTEARQEFYYRASKETLISHVAIGKFCGGRDHSTVSYGVAAHCKRNGLEHPRDLDCSIVDRKAAHNLRYKAMRQGAA